MISAMNCAETIAKHVHKGNFWPPQPLKASWDDSFESLFLNGKPGDCIEEETIMFLKGSL
jgi:hypothetical protein